MNDARERVLLAGMLYRATMRAYAATLAARGAPPPSAEDKRALHERVEHAAWDLPREALARIGELGVDDPLPDDARLLAVVESAVAAQLRSRGLG